MKFLFTGFVFCTMNWSKLLISVTVLRCKWLSQAKRSMLYLQKCRQNIFIYTLLLDDWNVLFRVCPERGLFRLSIQLNLKKKSILLLNCLNDISVLIYVITPSIFFFQVRWYASVLPTSFLRLPQKQFGKNSFLKHEVNLYRMHLLRYGDVCCRYLIFMSREV